MRYGSLQDGMGIGTSIAKGVDPGSPYSGFIPIVTWSAIGPGSGLGHDLDVPFIDFDFGVDILDANSWRNFAFLKSKSDLDDTRYTTGRLTVAEICFDLD